jgi:hypothetical protein
VPQDTTPTPLAAKIRRALRKEFTDFFRIMRTPERGWPAIPDQEFVDALADSLLEVGKQQGKGVAFLQTLVHELQDRINDNMKG